MNSGYTGKFLYVNLSSGESRELTVPQWFKNAFVGGKGFGLKLLYDLVPPKCDPLGAENILMFMTGPLTGTLAPSMRACVVTKSPLTGTLLDSYFGGSFGHEIKYCGYDGLIITGKAAAPVYLWIDDGHLEIRPARNLWGKDTLETNHLIKENLKDDSIKVASIGPAGEKLVYFALVSCEYNRQAGRGGAGAVMGSKNLKAVALRGRQPVKVRHQKEFLAAVELAYHDLKNSPDIRNLMQTGTASSVPFANENGVLPRRNYFDGTFDNNLEISDFGQNRDMWLRNEACTGCPVHCSKVGYIRSGRYRGTVSDIVEYESAAMLGSNLEIGNTKAVIHLAHLCDLLGLDSMSTGGVIGFAMEAAEKKSLPEMKASGYEIKFGNIQAAEALIKAIAHREGTLGNLLADGVHRAAVKIGSPNEQIAVHIKGLETPAWGPRGAPGIALSLMTADRGGCHQRGMPLGEELGGLPWKGHTVDRLAVKGKAEIVIHHQNYLAALDTFVKCDFGTFGISPRTYVKLYRTCTGHDLEMEDEAWLQNLGAKIWNLGRLYNLREGLEPAQDTLPHRFRQPLPSGPCKGHRFTRNDIDSMREEYYYLRGWTKDGIPTEELLHALHLARGKTFSI
jgi:aldehyde:ferredoxin oxidoreductase